MLAKSDRYCAFGLMKISIVIPTKNNADILEKCLKAIRDQDFEEEVEIIIVDGHSDDGTVDIAKKYGCKILYESIGTISGARNLGVENSSGDYLVFTDADCVPAKDWLKNIIKEFRDGIASVGGPNITPGDDTEFAKCVGDVLELLSAPGARYTFNAEKVVEIYHNPTCNSAYRREVFQEVGGFNPKLVACDDEELDYRIRKKGYRILFTPHAVVYHYRRPTWKKFAKMAWNYGIGRGQVIKLSREFAKWYYCTPLALILLIVILFALSFVFPILFIIALIILIAGVIGIGLMGLYLAHKKKRSFLIYSLLIAIWFWGYGLGMLRGLLK